MATALREDFDAPALAEIASYVAKGAHAALVLDRAGWHMSEKLVVPQNITLVALLPKTPS